MWIKYITATPENRVGDIVFVGDEEAKGKIEAGKAVGVTGPDGKIEEAQIVTEPVAVEKPKTPRKRRAVK